MVLNQDWKIVKARQGWIDFTNSSRTKQIIYVRLDGRISQKTLAAFTAASCDVRNVKEVAIRQASATSAVTAELK